MRKTYCASTSLFSTPAPSRPTLPNPTPPNPIAKQEEEIELSASHAHDPSHDLDLDDICDMSDLHQAPLLWTLRRRWQGVYGGQKIYTRAGTATTLGHALMHAHSH